MADNGTTGISPPLEDLTKEQFDNMWGGVGSPQSPGLTKESLRQLLEAKSVCLIDHGERIEEQEKPKPKLGLFSKILPHADEESKPTDNDSKKSKKDEGYSVLFVPPGEASPSQTLYITKQEMDAMKRLGNNILSPDGRAELLRHLDDSNLLMELTAGLEEAEEKDIYQLEAEEKAHKAWQALNIHMDGVALRALNESDVSAVHADETPAEAIPEKEFIAPGLHPNSNN